MAAAVSYFDRSNASVDTAISPLIGCLTSAEWTVSRIMVLAR